MPSDATTNRQVQIGLGVVAAVILLYSVLVVQRLLLGVIVAVVLVAGYLIVRLSLRLVRALERIADALEAPDDEASDVDATDDSADGWGDDDVDGSS